MNLMKKVYDRRLKDFINTLGANLISLFTGFITAFVIPKLLGIVDYGYFKLFTFYLTYVGILHFGFNDGIYVKYGSYDYEQLPRVKFKTYFALLFKSQCFVAVVILIFSLILEKDFNRKIIYIFIAINIVIANINTFFDFINQFTRRFKIYASILSFNKIAYLLVCISVFFINKSGYVFFISAQTIINIITLFLNIKYNKELVLFKGISKRISYCELKELLGIGFLIMLANLMSKLIIGLDRIFIDRFFTLEDFAMYSFVISILNLFNVLMSALTTVVYPYLARATTEKRGLLYLRIKNFLVIVVGLSLSVYFITVPIITNYLTEYTKSLPMLLILFPTVLFTSQILIVSVNYYKVMNLQKKFMNNNVFALLTGVLTASVAYIIFKSVTAIAISSLVTFIIWVLYTDFYFSKILKIRTNKINVLQFLMTVILLLLGYYVKWYIGFILYIILFIIFNYIFLRHEIKKLFSEGLAYFS